MSADLSVVLAKLREDVIRDDTKARRYSCPVGEVPGVTTVLKSLDKPALVFWSSKVQSEACEAEALAWLNDEEDERGDLLKRLMARRQAHRNLSKKAADMGVEGHKLAEYEFRKQLGLPVEKPRLEHPREANMILAAIMEWAKSVGFRPVAVEQPVWSKHGFAGTLDWLAYVADVLTLGDWKSNDRSRIYRESYLQNHALRGALKEHGIEAAGYVVAVPRDGQGEINPQPVAWRELDYQAFLGLLNVHKWSEMVA